MAAEFDWLNRRMPDLTPAELAAIRAASPYIHGSGNYAQRSAGNYTQYGGLRSIGTGDAESIDMDPGHAAWSSIDGPNIGTDGRLVGSEGWNGQDTNYYPQYDQDGRFLGYALGTDDSSWRDFITAMAMMAPAIAGVYGWAGTAAEGGAAAGVGGGAGAGGGAGGAAGAEALSGMDLAADAAIGSGNNIWTAGQGLSGGAGLSGMDLAGDASYGSGNNVMTAGEGMGTGTTGVSNFRQGEISNYQSDPNAATKAATTSGNMTDFDRWWEGVKQTAGVGAGNDPKTAGYWDLASKVLTGGGGWGDVVGGLLGAYAGYQSGKDKENTTKTEPWGPAQPYLQGLLREGAGLFDQYKATPFSDAERNAYGNYGNVLDFINHAAPDLMSGFDATAAGRNQFSRDNPRRGLIGSNYRANANPVAWQPGLLGDFGTTTAAVRRR